MDPIVLVVIAVALIAGVLAGWLVGSSRSAATLQSVSGELQKSRAESDAARVERERAEGELAAVRVRLEAEQQERATARTRLEETGKYVEELKRFVDESREQLTGSYASLSQVALKNAVDQLSEVVKPHLEGAKTSIGETLDAKGQSIEALLKPVREMIEKYRGDMEKSEKQRNESLGSIGEQIRSLLEANHQARQETAKLVSALSHPAVSGSWGENTLRNCVEQAGMSEFCDFDLQETVTTEGGKRQRPDLIVRLPGDRVIAVDSKAPLESYLEAAAEQDEARRDQLLLEHAAKIKRHVESLSRKDYQSSIGDSLDFTVLFVGGEQFLSAALLKDPTLFEFAVSKKIYLASPMVLLPLLRAVAAGWRADRAEQSARESLEVGLDLCKRFDTFFSHLAGVGTSLAKSVELYNKAIQSGNTRLIPQIAKLQSMVGAEKQMQEAPAIDRLIEAAAVDDPRLVSLRDDTPRG